VSVVVPAETRSEIVRLYTVEGLAIARIAKIVFWAYATVRKVLLEEGVELRPRGIPVGHQRLTQEQVDQTIDLYMQGLSLEQVGERLGIAENAVRNRLAKVAGACRNRADGIKIARRFEFEQHGEDGLTARQRVLFTALTDALPAAVPTVKLAVRLGAPTRATREVLEQLEAFGLVRRLPRHHHRIEWRRTDLAAKDVLRAALAPPVVAAPPAGEEWLPVEPIAAWLAGLIANERRKTMRAIKDLRDDTHGSAEEGEGVVALRLGISARHLYRLMHEQKRIPLGTADALLIRSGEMVTLEDLWPHLAIAEAA
jgi:AraC-like DNA-binding protein